MKLAGEVNKLLVKVSRSSKQHGGHLKALEALRPSFMGSVSQNTVKTMKKVLPHNCAPNSRSCKLADKSIDSSIHRAKSASRRDDAISPTRTFQTYKKAGFCDDRNLTEIQEKKAAQRERLSKSVAGIKASRMLSP